MSHREGVNPTGDAQLSSQLKSWLPFIAERSQTWRHPSGRASLWCWETHLEGMRGSHYAETRDQSAALVITGWWREPDAAPLSASIADVTLAALTGHRTSSAKAQGFERGLADFTPAGGWGDSVEVGQASARQPLGEALNALHVSPGQFAVAICDQEGGVHAVNGAFGGSPLYYAKGVVSVNGSSEPVSIVSNRASLISLCLNGGSPASPRPEVLGWLLARSEHPIGDEEVPFPGVTKLHAGQRLYLNHQGCHIEQVPLPEARRSANLALYESLVWRVGQLGRYPDLTLKMSLTGGFDSRMVLAGLLGAGLTDLISEYFICAHAEHADTLSALKIAERYQLPFQRDDAGRWQAVHEPMRDRLRRHNFLVEYLCSAWDIMSGPETLKLDDYALITGHYGELYRGHAKRIFSLSWPTLKWHYTSRGGVDRHSLLTREMIQRFSALGGAWLDEQRSTGMRSDFALDDLHRHARMEGWATQCRQVEALGYTSFAPLACVTTRAHYESLSLREREEPTISFALIRQADEDLWRLPFAKKAWPASLTHDEQHTADAPCVGGGAELGYQMKLWLAEVDELSAWLLDSPPQHPLWSVCDRDKLTRKLSATRAKPTAQSVKSIMCACALKLALDEPLAPSRFSRDGV